MSDSKSEVLARVPLFRHASPKELAFVASRADEVEIEAGRTLIRQGEPSDSFYVLLEGEATVEVDGAPRPAMKAGDFFGEISMLDRGPATATVVTSSPARALVMSHAQFRDAIKGNDGLLASVMTAMAERLRADQTRR
jgi:CRP/FNR family transcriptional regulator, cyclic AMP receptor protein